LYLSILLLSPSDEDIDFTDKMFNLVRLLELKREIELDIKLKEGEIEMARTMKKEVLMLTLLKSTLD
jgi:hypothetical protein